MTVVSYDTWRCRMTAVSYDTWRCHMTVVSPPGVVRHGQRVYGTPYLEAYSKAVAVTHAPGQGGEPGLNSV